MNAVTLQREVAETVGCPVIISILVRGGKFVVDLRCTDKTGLYWLASGQGEDCVLLAALAQAVCELKQRMNGHEQAR